MNPMYYPNYGYNPVMQSQQQRLMELEQQYPQFQQPRPTQNFIKCRAVTSFDEAKASMVDLDGSINVFVDTGNKQIYTKQINLDGTATLNTYKLMENTQPIPAEKPVENYVKQEELEAVCENFNNRFDKLQRQLQELDKQKAGGGKK